MSEEEIIDKIQEIIEYSKLTTDIGIVDQTDKIEAIQGLLDLYNKEKDLNNELQIRYKIEHEKYLKEKEKNKESENADLTTVYMNGFYDGEKKCKDKIRELKQKIDKEHDKAIIEFMRKKENFTADGDVAQTLNWVSGQLEELSEERN